MAGVPIVDFSALSLVNAKVDFDSDAAKEVANKMKAAFSNVGFVCLTNVGVANTELEELWEPMNKFFQLPDSIKGKIHRKADVPWGYLGKMEESLDSSQPGDYKELLDIVHEYPDAEWPEEDVPGIRAAVKKFFGRCHSLADRLLRLLPTMLGIPDSEYFIRCHRIETSVTNGSAMRINYYPPNENLLPGQLRCGAHTDWGTFTLLFQDEEGGLQILPTGASEWIDATPVPGGVYVNICDMLQRWTSDQFISTRHRVVNPSEGDSAKKSRRSVAFFISTDRDYPIKSLFDDKYEPITYGEWEIIQLSDALGGRY